ncbi:SMI1/KNR4 family protein [Lentibacillus sp. Marseille-P4043]|uniref:SMI1/KNR4 family protein n=1 Tax=Lentibacillus sp. Marseille-P4043 TaxID=2040293 RepID=UPI000D0B3C03|nr:SMI1/KNR4 family protein [Lentibacillus sp. Marseille-P4043]
MNNELLEMINKHIEKGDFTGRFTNENIDRTEQELGVDFPEGYKEFIKRFGAGGICGVDVLGIEGMDYASVVESTKQYRGLGLPKNYLVIEDVDEFVYCLNTMDDSVVRWDDISKQELKRYLTFDEYLKDSFQEAIDNMD